MPGANREILEVAELLDLRQRIDVHLARQVEERLGPHAEVGILEHLDRRRADLAIAGRAEQRQRPPPDVGLGMQQQRAQRRLPAARLLHLEQSERVADLRRVAARQLRAQRLGRRLFDRGRGRALGVEAMAMDALVDRPDVLGPQAPRHADPDRDEHQVDRRRAAQPEAEPGNQAEEALGREPEEHRAAAVGDAVADDVDRVLERDALRRRDRQIEQLVARLVDREAEALIEGVRQEHRPERREQPDERRAEAERERQDEDGDRDAEAAQRRAGDEQLQEEADRAEREVERAEEPRQRVGVAGEPLVGDEAQLKRRPLRRDGDEEHQGGHQPQVRAAGDLANRIADRLAARRPQPHHLLAPETRVGHRHDHRGQHDERRQHQQHVDRAADRLDQVARQDAAGDRAKRRPGADQPEQPLGLPRVEERVREAPRLHRRDDAEAVDPDEEHARQHLERVEPERLPEQQHVGGEEQQRRDGDQAGADAGDGAGVERHEQRQRDRHGGVDVDERVRTVFLEEQAVPDRFGEQERGDDDGDVEKGEKDRQTLARPDVEEPAQPQQHGFPGSLLQFPHRIGCADMSLLQRVLARIVDVRARKKRHGAADVRLRLSWR